MVLILALSVIVFVQSKGSLYLRYVFPSSDCLTDIRQNLAAPRLVGKQDSVAKLAELLSNMQSSVIEQMKSVLNNLQVCVHVYVCV